ncbi:MAG TPA: T9SS type A sorting domain-containing protein [Puia sp.]|nr:T9SS type A sorting domain-containing protein [Puia sp.]
MKLFVPTTVLPILCLLMTRPCPAQISTGPANPGTAADVSLAGSSFTWNTPNGALSAGGSSATTAAILTAYTGTTDYLQLTNFGFAIPTGSTIDGIQANVTHMASGLSLTIGILTVTGSVTDNIVQLVGPGVTSVNKASGASWPTSNTVASYGSSSDGWGTTVWTAAMVNSPGFGVAVSANMNGNTLLGVDLIPGAAIDLVTINITYSLPVTLPVQLDQWAVVRQGDVDVLRWQAGADAIPASTQASGAPAEFIVERSANSSDWSDLATIAASSGLRLYTYTDEEPFANGPTYYRLRLHSEGRPDSWSTIQVLAAKQVQHPVINVYPNPFHNTVNVSAADPFTRLTLKDRQGATLWVKEFSGGANKAQLPAAGLPQGLYFLTIDGATYKMMKE